MSFIGIHIKKKKRESIKTSIKQSPLSGMRNLKESQLTWPRLMLRYRSLGVKHTYYFS